MRKVENISTRGLINAAALHSHKTVFNNIKKSYTVCAADFVKLENNLFCAHLLVVERDGNPRFKIKSYIRSRVGSVDGRNAHFKKTFFLIKRLIARIFKVKPLV